MKFMKKNGGFTLVELIVVIAILAILAGVAVPAYSGYVEKAEASADEALLAELNTAFASACAMSGESHIMRGDMQNIKLAEGLIPASYVFANEIIDNYFDGFYEGGEFKVFTTLNYNKNIGMFINGDALIEQLREWLNNSSYNGNLEVVVDKVDMLTTQLADYMEVNFASLSGSGFAEYLTELGIAADDYDAQSQAAILYLAQNAAGMTETNVADATYKVTDMLATLYVNDGQNGVTDADITSLAGDTGSSLASYAVLYAVAEGFALQQGTDSDEYKALKNAKLDNPQSVLTAIDGVFANNEDALAYLQAGNVEKDVTAYFEAMKAINNNQSQLESDVKNGNTVVDSATIQDLLEQLGN